MRYYENQKYSKPNSPIFVELCGEWTCEIKKTGLFPYMIGATNNASLYALEHRFYGKSVINYKEHGVHE